MANSRIAVVIAVIIAVIAIGSVLAYSLLVVNTVTTSSSSITSSSSSIVVTSVSSSSLSTTSSSAISSSISSQGSTTSTSTQNANISSSSWLTYHNGNSRSGYDPNEPSINTTKPSLAWTSEILDGDVYAEPLVFNNTVYVATENDSIYALNEFSGDVIWRVNLGTPVPGSTLPCGDIDPSGITGTPVIDPARSEIFVVAYTYIANTQHHEFFALSLNNGKTLFQRNVDPPGVSPLVEQERGALGIANGMVYFPYGGLDGDCGQYHGFVLGVPENNTGNTLSYKTPTGREGGIWAPSGVAIDTSGNVWVATGNSEATTNFDFGDAVIKLSPTLQELDYFAPSNWASLNSGDVDLGSTAPILLTNNLVFQIGKEGVGYLISATNPGKIGGEEYSSNICGAVFAGNAFVGSTIYVPCTDGVVAVNVDSSVPNFSISWRGPGFRPGAPIVAGDAIWVVDTDGGNLYALNPSNGNELFSYSLGNTDHFITPTSSDGKIFVGATDTIFAFDI